MKLRKSLSVLLAAAISLSMLPFSAFAEEAQPDATPPVPALRDVSGSWAADSIERWVEYGVFQGDQAGNFNPTASMTRAAFAQTLVNLMGYTEKAENTFADVAEDAWYADAVLKAAAAGILQGDGKNANPDGTITREQAAVMLCRAFGISATPGAEIPYADGEAVSTWATAAVAALTERGMVSGVGNNTFAPGVSINRASIAKLLDNMVSEYVLDEVRTITGEVKGLVIVAGTGKVTLKDAALSENLIVAPKAQGAALTLSGKTTVPSLDIRGDKTQVVVNSGAAVTAVTAAAQGVKLSGSGAVATVTATAGTVDVTTKGTAVVNQGADKVTASGKTVAQGKTVTTGKGATGHSSGSNSGSKVTEATASTPEEMAAALENPDIATIHVTDRAALGIQNNRATLTIQRPGSLTLDFGALKLGSVYLTLNAPNLTALNFTDSGAYPAGAVFYYIILNTPQATVTNGLACSAAQINAISQHTYVAQDVNTAILMLCPGALSVEDGAGEPEVQVYPEYVGGGTVAIRGAVGKVTVATDQDTPTALPTIALEGATVTDQVWINASAAVEGQTVKLTLDSASAIPELYADALLAVEGEGRVEALIAEADVTLNADVDLLQVKKSGLTLTLGENAAVKALETAQNVTLAGTGTVESLDVTAASGTVAVTAPDTVAIGQVTKPEGSGADIKVNGSAPAILVKAGRPNNLSGGCADVVGKGVIKKVDATMEYATDPDAESWTKITDANLVSSNQIVLAAGTYYVRVAGTPDDKGGFSVLPSESVKVKVPGAVRASAVAITLDAKEVTTALVGDELYATWPEDLPSGQNKAYQWYADGVAIDNQTYYSYTVRAEDVGKTLTVALTTAKSAEDADDATVTSQPVEVGRLSLKTDGLTLTYEGKDVYTLAGTVAESGFTPKALNVPIPALAAALKGCKYTSATLGGLVEGNELKQTNPALELFTYDSLGSGIALEAGKWVGTTTLSGTSLDIPLLAGEDVILAVGGKTYTIHNQVAVTNAPGAAVLTEAAALVKDMTVPAGQVLTLNAALTGTGKLLGADATAKLMIGENGSYGSLTAGAYLWKDGQWTEDATLYTVAFDSNGGSAVNPAAGLRLNAKVTEPAKPTKDGFTFGGWYKDSGLTDKWDFDKDVVTGDATLYAKWTEAGTTPVLTLGEQLPAGPAITLTHNGGTEYTLAGDLNSVDFSGCADLNYPTPNMMASWLNLPATYVTLEGLLPQADGVRVVQTNDALELFTYDSLDSGIVYDETAKTWIKDKTYDLSAATGDDLIFSLPLLGQSKKQTKGATVTLAMTVGGETYTYTIHNKLTALGSKSTLPDGNAVLMKDATVDARFEGGYRIRDEASLTLGQGVTLTIPKDSTLGMEGKLINNGGTITGEGTLEVYDADSLAVALASTVSNVVLPDMGGGNTITVDGNLTVPEGMTLALEENTVLKITGNLIVNGTIAPLPDRNEQLTVNGALNVTGTITVGNNGAIDGGYQGVNNKAELEAALGRADVFPRIRLLKSIDFEGPITLTTEGLVLDGNRKTIDSGLQIAADGIEVKDLTVNLYHSEYMVTGKNASDRIGVYLCKTGDDAYAVSNVKLNDVDVRLWSEVESYAGPLCGIHVYGGVDDAGTGNVIQSCSVTFAAFTESGGQTHERDGIYIGSAAVNLADNTVTKASRGICIQGIGEASETVLEGNRVTIQTGGLGGYAYDLSFSAALCENFGTATSTSNTTALYASLIGLIGKDQVIHARANDKEERWTKADGGEITREYKDGETWTAITGPTAE